VDLAPQLASAMQPPRDVIHPKAARRRSARELSTYLGMVLFLGTWTMMFAGLFFSYAVVRNDAPVWPPPGEPRLPVGLPALNTLVLLASSVTLATGLKRLASGRATAFPKWLGATILLGAAFLALQLHVWIEVARRGLHASTGIYGSVFYGLTCFHALHVVVGLVILGVLAVPAFAGRNLTSRFGTVRLAAMFWHFVDVVWVVMFLTVYVL
jgi:cytochrome c oxidase subunit 3